MRASLKSALWTWVPLPVAGLFIAWSPWLIESGQQRRMYLVGLLACFLAVGIGWLTHLYRRDLIELRRAQQALRQSEERFRSLVEMSSDAIVLIDGQGRVLYTSPSVERIMGYSATELLSQSGLELVHPDDLSGGQEVLQRAVQNPGEHVPFLVRARHKDGSWHWVEGLCSNHLSNSAVQAIVVNYRDATESHRAASVLRQSEERYRRLVEASPDAIFVNRGNRLVFVNPAMLQLLGATTLEQILGKTPFDIIHPDYHPLAQERMRQMHKSDQPVPLLEKRYVRLDGTAVDVEAVATPFTDQDGPAILVIARDISERKRAEQERQESEAKYRAIFENAVEGFFQTTLEGRFLTLNPALARIYGYASPQEVIAHFEDVGHQLYVDPSRRQEFMSLIEAHGVVHGFEFQIARKDGSHAWVSESSRAVRNGAGKLLYYEGTVEDITERKRAEEERRQLEAQIQHAQKLESLGVLAGGIAHDFNNLLTGILGYASLSLMQLPDESVACPMLREIEKSAERAADLTRQMLAYSGRGKFVIQVLRLETLVQEMIKLLGTVVSKKATLQLDLESASVEGDATQIRQVVMNLITNASDALEGQCGVIGIRTGVREADAAFLRSPYLPEELPPGAYACVEVTDTGCGMSPETLARIFDPFFTTKFTGRGLGLAAVLGIVKGHRGTIKVDSTPGRGTVFQVLFPRYTGPSGDGLVAGSEESPRRGQGIVLVVDDEASLRTFARDVLECTGFEVREAADGREGLDLFSQHHEEIVGVLLDLTMPRMDGVEVLRELRRRQPDVPVLVMSGYSELEVSQRFAGMGASGFIQKPFHARDLIARLWELVPSDMTNHHP
jgi:PAS domain S-box-containing protein